MSGQVHYAVVDGIAVITIDNPPVNALSVAVQVGLRDAVARAFGANDVRAVVLTGQGHTFVAGADVKHFRHARRAGRTESLLPALLVDIDGGPKPVVAALEGRAFGGGLELALAAHYRIATPDCLLGQPEVKLGLIPGAGGTQRLPRLVPFDVALDLCVLGEPIEGARALEYGLVDRLAATDLREAGVSFAREAASASSIPRTCERAVRGVRSDSVESVLAKARAAASRHPHLPAPLAAIDAVERALTSSFVEGCGQERAAFERLLVSDQAQARIHLFLAERAVANLSLPVSAPAVIQPQSKRRP